MSTDRYDDLVLGSGAGGKLLSWHLARAGRRTAVVERRYIGGSCPNINCLPRKNQVWSAKVADLIHHAAAFGVVTGSTAIDIRRVRQRKRDMVDGLIAMHLDQYRASGAELIMGTARFLGPKTVEVRLNDGGRRTLAGERVFLNLGKHATIPSVPGLADARPPTNNALPEGIQHGQRSARYERARRLGDRRVRRQPAVHARVRSRLSDHPGQPGGRRSQHTRPPRPVLPVHGPAAGAGRPERRGSTPTGH